MTDTTNTTTFYDDLEIHPVRHLEDHDCWEPCEPDQADMWSLYGHLNTGGLQCIGDFKSHEAAEEVRRRLDGYVRGTVLIEVSGGVADVTATQGRARAFILDWDDLNRADPDEIREVIAEVEAAPIDPRRKEALLEDLKLLRLRATMMTVA